jgi:hypothetical protein
MARYWSWASLEFSVIQEGKGTKLFTEINSVAYSDSVESELVRGAGRDVLGTSDPVYMPNDMSFDLFAKWCRTFIADATDQGAVPLGDLDFRMVHKHKLRTEANAIIDEIDFQILTLADTRTQGAPALLTNVTCLPTLIKRNGVQL